MKKIFRLPVLLAVTMAMMTSCTPNNTDTIASQDTASGNQALENIMTRMSVRKYVDRKSVV